MTTFGKIVSTIGVLLVLVTGVAAMTGHLSLPSTNTGSGDVVVNTAGLASTDINTCAKLATILTGQTTGTCGSLVFSSSPTFTGTANFALLTATAGTSTNAFAGRATGNTASFGGTASTSISTTGALTIQTLSGLLKATTGVVSAASVGTDYYAPGSTDVAVADGGTGVSSLAAGQVLFGNGSSALSLTSNLFYDSANQRFSIGSSTPVRSLVASSTASQECTLADGATITMDLRFCNQARVTLGATGRTFNFSNESEALGQPIRVTICEDGTGSRTITTWDTSIRWAGGTAPTLTATASHCDVIAGFTTAATGTPIIVLDKSLNF